MKLTILKPGEAIIEGFSSSNFRNSGDLFILNGTVNNLDESGLVEITGEYFIGNRTNFMYKNLLQKSIINITTSLKEDNISNTPFQNVVIYPNPVFLSNPNLNLALKVNNACKISVEIINSSGIISNLINEDIELTGLKYFSFNLENYPAGSYILRVKSNNFNSIYKFNIIK